MRVTVDKCRRLVLAHRAQRGGGVHVEPFAFVRRCGTFALGTQAARHQAALGERPREHLRLPRRIAHLGAKLLVRQVADAPGVAVRQQCAFAER